MEEKAQSNNVFIPDINFYRYAVYSILNRAKNPMLGFNEDQLRMNKSQFKYALSFFHSLYHRPIKPEELMFIDSYCENIVGTFSTVAVNELILHDEKIAGLYADLMVARHRKTPDHDTRPTIYELLDLIVDASDASEDRRFSYSELDNFSAETNDKAKLVCLANGCTPVYLKDGLCIGAKTVSKKIPDASHSAVIYAAGGHSALSFENFLASDEFALSSATAEISITRECFAKLTRRYDDLCICPDSLPQLKSERYAGRQYTPSELSMAKMCEAFFTEEAFGKEVILIHGRKSSVKKLCAVAATYGLSSFSGIFELKKAKKAYKKADHSNLIKIKSKFYRLLCEMCDNLNVELPEYSVSAYCTEDIIPLTREIYHKENDRFISSDLHLSASALPFHSSYCALIATAAHALSLRKEPSIGQISLSLNTTLCFSDRESAGISLSALLGVYAAARRMSIPITFHSLSFADSDSIRLSVTAHDFSNGTPSSVEGEAVLRKLLNENIDLADVENTDIYNFIHKIRP